MIGLLARSVSTIDRRLLLLAPPNRPVAGLFDRTRVDDQLHGRLLREVQRLRGGIYLDDGAVRPGDLSDEGLHETPEDARSWHLIMLDREGRLSSCAWCLEHEDATSIEQLRVRHCPLNGAHPLRERLQRAVATELRHAREEGLRYAEVGGWAVSRTSRCTSEGLLLALAAYSLGRRIGGALGLTTATVRHSSSTILRRLGGTSLEVDGGEIPSYFDERYRCEMEILRFDSRRPSPKYAPVIELLKERLSGVGVIAPSGLNLNHACEQPSFAA